jgi:hypothetical protein
MHATVSLYRMRPGCGAEALERIRGDYLELVRTLDGWEGYQLIGTAPDEFVTISYWRDQSVVDAAVERIWPWRDANLADLILEGPGKGGLPLLAGDVLVDARPDD